MLETLTSTPAINILDQKSRQDYQRNIDNLLKKRPIQVSIIQFGMDGPIIERFSGVPDGTQKTIAGSNIFRHYTNREVFEKIQLAQKLKSGVVPYAQVAPLMRVYWNDLNGIFVTTPQHRPQDIGVPDSRHFVDFTMPPDLPLLQIKDGILLLPKFGPEIEIPVNFINKGVYV